LERLDAVRRHVDRKSFAFQASRDEREDPWLVLHNQDPQSARLPVNEHTTADGKMTGR
jgi:hypothetical protein